VSLLKTTIKHRRQEWAWQQEHDAKAPKNGEVAPDFELFDVSGTSSFRLSDFQGKKPVVLIFGSCS